jgi:hypothetical protein
MQHGCVTFRQDDTGAAIKHEEDDPSGEKSFKKLLSDKTALPVEALLPVVYRHERT